MTTVRSDRRHRFPVDGPRLWAAVSDVGSYRHWWPWLTGLDAAAFAAGERWRCTIRPPLPYVLRFELVLEEVEPPRFVTARLEGDLIGAAALDIVGLEGATDGARSELHLVSVLEPAHRAARAVATLAPAAVRFGHDWVLDSGLRRFRDRAFS